MLGSPIFGNTPLFELRDVGLSLGPRAWSDYVLVQYLGELKVNLWDHMGV